ncbi:T9SS type A sorting domain-containing protein [Nonlabens dokdonensis]|nr:T9SS type A sorting domain-containing protein [Nonlabens dokdonensis]
MTLFLFIGVTSITYGQCTNCDDPLNDITHDGNGTFTAASAQAYYWTIENCNATASIDGANTSRSINVTSTVGSVNVRLTRFINGECIQSCETFTVIPVDTCGIEVGPAKDLNLLTDINLVFVAPLDLAPGWSVTNISIQLTFQDGTVLNVSGYLNSEGNPQTDLIPVDCENGVIQSVITVTGTNGTQTCSDTTTHRFKGGPVCGTDGYDFEEIEFKTYPNPTNSIIKFSGFEKGKNYKLTIANSSGKVVFHGDDLTKEIDLSREIDGIYFYTITDDQGNKNTGKVIKR